MYFVAIYFILVFRDVFHRDFFLDMFASRTNAKCEKYVSWLKDPYAYKVDAFSFNWKDFYFYAFPPFCIILKIFKKIMHEKSCGIMVVPLWQTQPWFPLFNKMLTNKPIYFKPSKNLLLSSDRKLHPLWSHLTLVVGRLSGKHRN